MKTLLRKRLVPLALSLALLAGLLAIPAAAAPAAPTEELADIAYYGGSYTNCKMPYDMANAYVQALDSLANNGIMATLADPAGDGMPLLLTVDFQFTGNLTDTLKVWTWNGISAMPYDFEDDTELGWTFGYDFGTYDGNEAALRVGDGVGLAIGDACGYLYYAVNRGQLEIIRHTMTYTADAWNGTTASGTLLPLVNASGTLYTWGSNLDGQLGTGGLGDTTDEETGATLQLTPTAVSLPAAVSNVTVGAGHTAAILSDGTLWTWGRNDAMQLGLTEAGAQVWEPGQVVELVPVQAVSAGTDQTVCLLTDGEVQAWGSPAMGQLGSGTPQEKAAEPDVQTADAGAVRVDIPSQKGMDRVPLVLLALSGAVLVVAGVVTRRH